MSVISKLNFTIASVLDSIAIHAHKLLPIDGAWVGYTPNLSWRIDAWKESTSTYVFQIGGYEASVDLKHF